MANTGKTYQVSVRLYRHMDLELMIFGHAVIGRHFSSFIKETLRSFTRQTPFSIGAPPTPYVSDYNTLPVQKLVAIQFNTKEDADVIELLQSIKYGYRNIFIKNLLRMYLRNYSLDRSLAVYAGSKECYEFISARSDYKNNSCLSFPEVRVQPPSLGSLPAAPAPFKGKKAEGISPAPVKEESSPVSPVVASVESGRAKFVDFSESVSKPPVFDIETKSETLSIPVTEDTGMTGLSDAEADILNLFDNM